MRSVSDKMYNCTSMYDQWAIIQSTSKWMDLPLITSQHSMTNDTDGQTNHRTHLCDIFLFFSCGHATLWEALSVRPLVRPSMVIESKSGITRVLDTFCVPSATILWPRVTCSLSVSSWILCSSSVFWFGEFQELKVKRNKHLARSN